MTPEEKARQKMDAMLKASACDVQSKEAVNISAAPGVAVREVSFKTGEPDYTLFVDGKAIGTTEAKPEGDSLTGVEEQLLVPFPPLGEQTRIVAEAERRW